MRLSGTERSHFRKRNLALIGQMKASTDQDTFSASQRRVNRSALKGEQTEIVAPTLFP